MKTLACSISLALLFGAAASAQEGGDPLAGYVRTGETELCLRLASIDRINPVDDERLLVETKGGDVFLNEVNGRCSQATRTSTYLRYDTSLNQLCRGEIIDVVDQGANTEVGACSLGAFERLERDEGRGDTG